MKLSTTRMLPTMAAVLLFFLARNTLVAQAPTYWNSYAAASTNSWNGVTYGKGLYVAVAGSGVGNRVMTSDNGSKWTSRVSAADNDWKSVTYGDDLFVAVASSGVGNRVMTSSNGINWTIRASAEDNDWQKVTYANGLYVAVAGAGTNNRVMTSPDGVTWTSQVTPVSQWADVTYGNGLFVAVAASGTSRVMTSPDGITWTGRMPATDNSWHGITFGNGLFVAVASSGVGDRVMTSTDGITWVSRNSASDLEWRSVTYANFLFVVVAGSGTGRRIMASNDGIYWSTRISPADNHWVDIVFGNYQFVAVADDGSTYGVMTGNFLLPVRLTSFTVDGSNGSHNLRWQTAGETNNRQFDIERSGDAKSFQKIGTVDGGGTVSTTKMYNFTDSKPLAGFNYYRLKQIDLDDQYEYSKIIEIENEAMPALALAPNPVNEEFSINVTTYLAKTVQYRLLDINGKVIQQKNVAIKPGANAVSINASKLASGLYIIDVRGEGFSEQKKIVKN